MKYAVSVCFIRTRARTTIPVNPIPPTVAQHPQPLRQHRSHQPVKTDPRIHIDHPAAGIDVMDPIEGRHIDDQAAAILRGIPIAAPQTTRGYPRIRQATGAAITNTPTTIINATNVLTKHPPPPAPANLPDSRAA